MLSLEQLQMRKTGIGSSEIAVIAGIGRHHNFTPFDVWRSKVDPHYHLEETPAMKRGRILEPSILSWYAEDTGALLTAPGTVRHPRVKHALATPDGLALTRSLEEIVVEAKAISPWMAGDLGPAGTDQIPMSFIAQDTWEMSCTGRRRADLAALIGGDDFRIYTHQLDVELEGMLHEAAAKFWRDHVETGQPPDVDWSMASVGDWLEKRYQREVSKGAVLLATETQAALMSELAELEFWSKFADKSIAELINRLKDEIGQGAGLVSEAGKVTWLRSSGTDETDWREVAFSLFAQTLMPQREQLKLIAEHTKHKKGPRVFRKRWINDDSKEE